MKRSSESAAVEAIAVSLYDRDYVAWAARTAALLRARRFGALEVERVAEEIEDMGKRDLRELNSRMQVLLAHLLKWHHQPRKRSRSWRATIVTQRLEIEALLRDSPSLKRRILTELAYNFGGAVKRAAAETGVAPAEFPARCPFAIKQILNEDFFPG